MEDTAEDSQQSWRLLEGGGGGGEGGLVPHGRDMKAHKRKPFGFRLDSLYLISPAGALAVAGPLKFTLAEAAVVWFTPNVLAAPQRRVVYRNV